MNSFLFVLLVSLIYVGDCDPEIHVQSIQEGKRVICHFNSWSLERRGNAQFEIAKINASLCTHAIYAYIGIPRNRTHPSDRAIFSNVKEGAYSNFTALKQINPALITLASVGGWVHNPQTLSRMAATETSRSDFIRSAILFLERHNFDGIHLDWEYPTNFDKPNFVLLVKEMREAFANYSFTTSVSVSGIIDILDQTYDIPNISANVDFIVIKAYEYPRYTPKIPQEYPNRNDCVAGNAPIRDGVSNGGLNTCDPRNNVESSVNYWLEHGALANRLVLGMASYGRLTIKDQSNTGRNSVLHLPSQSFKLAYRDICEEAMSEYWSTSFEENQRIPLTESQFYQISYDNERSIREKCELVKDKSLSGGMLDSIDNDDFEGRCLSGKYPLLKAMWESLRGVE